MRDIFRASDLVIASGRGVLEAIACGTTTIAIGSKGYIGIMEGCNLLLGKYTNFGGFGDGMKSYQRGMLARDIYTALANGDHRRYLREAASSFIVEFFSQDLLDKKIISIIFSNFKQIDMRCSAEKYYRIAQKNRSNL
jgi:hypothetical protein